MRSAAQVKAGSGPRLAAVALVLGAVAGALAAVTLTLMHGVQHLVWTGEVGPWRIAATILLGGALIAVLRGRDAPADETWESATPTADDPLAVHRRRALRLAALGTVAVGFGGAVGPEAGLIAVVTELSAIVARRLAHSREEAREMAEFGEAAALAGLYASPPGGAAWIDDRLSGRRILHLVAGAAGFVGFLVVHHALAGPGADLGIPAAPAGDGQLLRALVPALVGAGVAVAFALAVPPVTALANRAPGGRAGATLAASAVLAVFAAFVPAVRFSGHEQIAEVGGFVATSAWGVLLGIALLKVLATAISLAGGWLGGAIFPLIFAGSAAGAATMGVVPGLDAGTAMVAGLSASAVVGLRKPLAAFLICAFVVGGDSWGALAVGTVVGALAGKFLPEGSGGH